MLISLPEPSSGFVFIKNKCIDAYIDEDGILKINEMHLYYDDLMYVLTYALKRQNVCPYCGEKIRKQELKRLDHMYPRDFGGFSIPDNLEPCCNLCNSDKGNLDVNEYKKLLGMNLSKNAKKKEKQKILVEKEKKRYSNGILLPDGMLEHVYAEKLVIRDYYKKLDLFNDNKSKRILKNLAYIRMYGNLKRPIVTDRNYVIMDGYGWYVAAIESGRITKIPIVRLENVELVKM